MMSFTQFRAFNDIVTSLCSTANTQITNYFISGTSTSIIIIFQFLEIFFLSEWEHVFLGAPSQNHTNFFPCPWITFLDAFLKKRMAPSTWKSEGVLNVGLKFVIKLYVIKS